MPAIWVRVLGGLAVDGVDARALGSRKARRLLELLALGRGAAVPVDVLVEELWPDGPPHRPADALAVLVSRLRARLGSEAIERRDAGYVLRYGRSDLDDLASLTARLTERPAGPGTGGPVDSVVEARALSRLALGADPAAVPAGRTGWAMDRSAEASRLVVRAIRVAATALAAAGQWPEAADAAARALDTDPFDEAALAVRMSALAASGRSPAALTEYDRFRRRLADELGVDPADTTQQLYRRILREPTGPAPIHAEPAEMDDAPVGRSAELAALDAAGRSSGSTRVLVVEGEAGIGKTTLVTAWGTARRAAGTVVLAGACGPHDDAVPLDAVIVTVGRHLRASPEPVDAGGPAGLVRALAAPGPGPSPDGGGQHAGALLADGAPHPTVLFAALATVLAGIAPAVLIVDDAHRGGAMLASFVDYLARRPLDLCVVLAVRSGEGEQFVGHPRIVLGPLDRRAVAALVGDDRAGPLFARTGGHPLLLAELAREPDVQALPDGLVDAVARRLESMTTATPTLRAAAALGGHPDPDLLSGVLGRPVVDVLADLETAAHRHLIRAAGPTLAFRHELIRQAIAAGVPGATAAGWHRSAARILARRPDVDPITVADHARSGGDRELATAWLSRAARLAAARFDHSTALTLLDEAVAIRTSPRLLTERARLHTLTGRYGLALADLDAAGGVDAATLEVRAWASYFDRRFDEAVEAADDGAAITDDPAVRTRCLMIGGRTRHAAGDLAGADDLLGRAAQSAIGSDRVTARAWLGILRAHQSRTDEALALLRPALRSVGGSGGSGHVDAGVGQTAAVLHGLLFTGHAHALAGRPAAALHSFAAYTDEVDRRRVPRFAGRGINFAGWVLRNVGAFEEGLDAHRQALDIAGGSGTAEVRIAALLDLADAALTAGDPDDAAARLAAAAAGFDGDLVFGWRLRFKADLLGGRLALMSGDPVGALTAAGRLTADAHRLGIPRYSSVARLLAHRARLAIGEPVDPVAVQHDLDLADASVALESWWWAGELGAAAGEPGWIESARRGATRLLAQAGEHRDQFQRHAARLVDRWVSGRPAPPAG